MSGVAYSCAAEGALSVLALVPEAAVTDRPEGCEDAPVLLHVTVCRDHVSAVRRWLRVVSPLPDEIDTFGTAYFVEHRAEVAALMEDTPVLSMVRAAS